MEQLPYVDLPRGKNEGEIIPLDIEVPTPNDDADDNENKDELIEEIANIDNNNDTYQEINEDDDLIDPDEDDLIDPDEEDDED